MINTDTLEKKLAEKFNNVKKPLMVKKPKKFKLVTTFDLDGVAFGVGTRRFNGVPVRFVYDLEGRCFDF